MKQIDSESSFESYPSFHEFQSVTESKSERSCRDKMLTKKQKCKLKN